MTSTILIPLTGHMALAGFLTTFLPFLPILYFLLLGSFGSSYIGKSLFTYSSLNCLGYWLSLPGLTCIFPLTLIIGYGNTKKHLRGSCTSEIIFLMSTVEKQSDFPLVVFINLPPNIITPSLALRASEVQGIQEDIGFQFNRMLCFLVESTVHPN